VTAPRELLDQLDALHAAGDELPWRLDDVERDIVDRADGLVAIPVLRDDAALIVAAVNALPQLTAALRAVLDVVYQLDNESERFDSGSWYGPDFYAGLSVAAGAVDEAITAALTPADTTGGAR
jgi:hypothetical protein